jgi:xanthine dehydrogenase accessory factor
MRENLSADAQFWRRMRRSLQDDLFVALVHLAAVRGSSPREEGALMGVTIEGAFFGSIGGGTLEFRAQQEAALALAALRKGGKPRSARFAWALGPEMGQCCGGSVDVVVTTFTLNEIALIDAYFQDAVSGDERARLLLFGAGHVGRALVMALAPLPFHVSWIDSRPEAFPAAIPANVIDRNIADPVEEVARAPSSASILVMTHDHALDLAITAAALSRDDLPFVGLIGSATKRARFERRLRELGVREARIASLVCPIGLPGIEGKEPAVIAASVAAQLLGALHAHGRLRPGA